MSAAANCSMNSGLPSAVAARSAARSRFAVAPLSASRCAASSVAAAASSGVERERRVCEQPAAPGGANVEKLGARERQHEDGEIAQSRREQLDEVEQSDVGPVEVLEDQHRRLICGDPFDEAPDRQEQAVAVGRGLRRIEAEDDPEILRDLLRLSRRQDGRDGVVKLLRRCFNGVGLEDAAQLLELEGEGGVRGALAVREGSPTDGATAAVANRLGELAREPRLPDPGRPDDRDEVRPPFRRHALPRPAENVELVTAPDERATRRTLSGQPSLAESDPRRDRSLLALCLDGRRGCVHDRVSRRFLGALAHEHGSDRRRGLEPRGRIDHVAGDHRLA